jgi:Protein of unknown function (DUF1360)
MSPECSRSPAPPTKRTPASMRGYSPDGVRPLRGYAATLVAYGGLVTAIGVATRLRGGRFEPFGPWDVAMLSIASHRLSRTLAKDAVASPLRAPFTRYGGVEAPAELHEEVRAQGHVGHVVGELLTCPFCLTQWVATGLTASYLLTPRAGRVVAATLSAVAGADFLHVAYAKLQQSS